MNDSFTSPKPMLRGETRCSTKNTANAITRREQAAAEGVEVAVGQSAPSASSTSMATVSGYTIRFGRRYVLEVDDRQRDAARR